MTIKEKHEVINQIYEQANAGKIDEALAILGKHKQDLPSDDFFALSKKIIEASTEKYTKR